MILLGDCLEHMRSMDANSIDAIVTDPPYGLSFMGKKWDYDVPSVEIWAECLRVLKPGGHLLAFAGTRTQHRMACRIEDAGFEIRDMIAWVYGSGFPKSHNGPWGGTALKPALEPITMARKPLIGTVAVNVQAHGTGALNIDGTRVPYAGTEDAAAAAAAAAEIRGSQASRNTEGWGMRSQNLDRDSYLNGAAGLGRWPANLIHDGSEEVLALFPDTKAGVAVRRNSGGNTFGGEKAKPPMDDLGYGDAGSAARFFYCAKADRADRNDGLPSGSVKAVDTAATMREREDADWPARNGNHHPTVKPTDLMRYLCRLVTPPGGIVLDPFMGSGSTGRGAIAEGFQFIGIELDPEYAAIAEARIKAVQPGLSLGGAA